ncbi:DEHA2D11132p [Debaryomyces hansenii CBS767]|uniref:DEHA2D11132p n=1 Tax=Debaryomyces hansenii (strain ATCC 36239 / CBS 767 / BCRC 21394 / JCM 1990 / NBRC 0083 / IGC 2968) TaxID=284592 RepID=Q6BS71_DEBHA|nr:DEHA2D11132p [Debaryomyces hansenii CBS767]CAG87110.2 DEHA2D11132p [Debaryomyces hansenii CBS767]|eukprot:XP_458949.2 DEHA2D11132p [Debaryomyces hansenii CBS767]
MYEDSNRLAIRGGSPMETYGKGKNSLKRKSSCVDNHWGLECMRESESQWLGRCSLFVVTAKRSR